jgi:hypothetical protein
MHQLLIELSRGEIPLFTAFFRLFVTELTENYS